MNHLLLVAIAVLLLNLPFGFWRAGTRKYSLPWLLAVHLPVPAVVGMRFLSGLGWQFITFPILVSAFLTGQYLGGSVRRWWSRREGGRAGGG